RGESGRRPRSRAPADRGRRDSETASRGGSSRATRSAARSESRSAPRRGGALGSRARRSFRTAASAAGRAPPLVSGGLVLPRLQRLIEAAPLAGGVLVLLPDRAVDLLAVDPDVRRGVHAQADLVALDLQNAHRDRVADANHLAQLPCQDQHYLEGSLPRS